MLKKDEIEWIKEQCGLYRSFVLQRLKVRSLCISHLELYTKLEKAEADKLDYQDKIAIMFPSLEAELKRLTEEERC